MGTNFALYARNVNSTVINTIHRIKPRIFKSRSRLQAGSAIIGKNVWGVHYLG